MSVEPEKKKSAPLEGKPQELESQKLEKDIEEKLKKEKYYNERRLDSIKNDYRIKGLKIREYEVKNKLGKKDLYSFVIFTYLLVFLGSALYLLAKENPSIYSIDENIISFLNKAFNSFILLIIPFFFGMIGAIARVLLAGINLTKSTGLILSSGLMTTFSWVAIKSGVLAMLLIPYAIKNSR